MLIQDLIHKCIPERPIAFINRVYANLKTLWTRKNNYAIFVQFDLVPSICEGVLLVTSHDFNFTAVAAKDELNSTFMC